MKQYMVKAIVNETIETSNNIIEKGDMVEGYLNSYHKNGCYSIQVELTQESGGVGSGIVVMDIEVRPESIEYLGNPLFPMTHPAT